MMFNFPFYPYQHSRYYLSHRYPYRYSNAYIDKNLSKQEDIKNTEDNHSKSFLSNNSVLFSIFGINLYYDDILLLCLIFFLYNEGVKDDALFIILILLLLS